MDWRKTGSLVDMIRDPIEAQAMYGGFVTNSLERLRLIQSMEELTDAAIARFEEGVVADIDFSDESLAVLDTMIGDGFSQVLEETEPELIEDMVLDLGSYLGQTIVQNIGGEWRFRNEWLHTAIYFPSAGAECFPYHRVARRLTMGQIDSLADFYQALLEVLGAVD